MPKVEQRNTIWMGVFVIALVIGGMCAVGYWQSYDIQCGGFNSGRQWSWAQIPPKYVCRA